MEKRGARERYNRHVFLTQAWVVGNDQSSVTDEHTNAFVHRFFLRGYLHNREMDTHQSDAYAAFTHLSDGGTFESGAWGD